LPPPVRLISRFNRRAVHDLRSLFLGRTNHTVPFQPTVLRDRGPLNRGAFFSAHPNALIRDEVQPARRVQSDLALKSRPPHVYSESEVLHIRPWEALHNQIVVQCNQRLLSEADDFPVTVQRRGDDVLRDRSVWYRLAQGPGQQSEIEE